ncbi:hypothetical protein GJ744_001708 [Endocarpon pusillum]|uniref:Uncharacterized protein n=1 Tax=Endocarpon pusillum TaxID=364733 RepID=A0A8H7E0Y0_9EURO|nr:hypothetical protein GJ744_001708 [Endocarpon pusillum]
MMTRTTKHLPLLSTSTQSSESQLSPPLDTPAQISSVPAPIATMFMPQSDQPSKAEVDAAELEASSNVRNFSVACLMLYIAPHVVDYVRKLF